MMYPYGWLTKTGSYVCVQKWFYTTNEHFPHSGHNSNVCLAVIVLCIIHRKFKLQRDGFFGIHKHLDLLHRRWKSSHRTQMGGMVFRHSIYWHHQVDWIISILLTLSSISKDLSLIKTYNKTKLTANHRDYYLNVCLEARLSLEHQRTNYNGKTFIHSYYSIEFIHQHWLILWLHVVRSDSNYF